MRSVLLVLSLALVGFLALQPSGAQQATINVTTLDDVVADDGECSLREALENAADQAATHDDCAAGDIFNVIIVPAGTITLSGTELHVTGAVTISGQGMDETVISGNSLSGVFHVNSGGSVAFEDLEIREGLASEGAGILHTLGELTLDRVRLELNVATNFGGGVFSSSSASLLAIIDSQFVGNTSANFGGGLVFDAEAGPRTASIVDSIFRENSAVTSGGGAWFRSGELLVMGSRFMENSANFFAGLFLWAVEADVVDSRIEDNVATVIGGGVGLIDGAAATFNGVRIEDNVAADGGGIVMPGEGQPTTVRIFDSVIINNDVPGNGGGIHMGQGTLEIQDSSILLHHATLGGSGIWVQLAPDRSGHVSISGSRFWSNVTVAQGGALYFNGLDGDGEVEIESSSFDNNNSGVGLYFAGVNASIVNSTIRSSAGTSIHAASPLTNLVITNSTIVGDYPGNVASNVLVHASQLATVTLNNSVVVLAREDGCLAITGGTILGTNNANDDGTCPGAIDIDGYEALLPPEFIGRQWFHRPAPGSALIDAANNALCPDVDQLGAVRFDGACDIGAIEFFFPHVVPGIARD